MNKLEELIKERDYLEEEFKRDYENKDVRLNRITMTVGPAMNYCEFDRIDAYIQYKKGIKNSFTEKANRIEDINYQIDLLKGDVKSRQALINNIIFLIPLRMFKKD